jgi:hypothetical protein
VGGPTELFATYCTDSFFAVAWLHSAAFPKKKKKKKIKHNFVFEWGYVIGVVVLHRFSFFFISIIL